MSEHVHTTEELTMNPVSTIKPKRPPPPGKDSDKPRCFLCRGKTGDLRIASAVGKARLKIVGDKRRILRETSCV